LAWKYVFDVFEKKQRFCVYAKFGVTWSKSFDDSVSIFKKPKKKKKGAFSFSLWVRLSKPFIFKI